MENEKKWFALKIKPKQEKKVSVLLNEKKIKHYLPLITVIRIKTETKIKIQVPLIPSYIFVNVNISECEKLKFLPGTFDFIKCDSIPSSIPEEQITLLQIVSGLKTEVKVVETDFLLGTEIEILTGVLKGHKASVVEINGREKIKIDLISVGKSVVIDLNKNYVRKV